ncbi:NUDIX domain-containing protein [Curtobacterium flaccumfaciens pv. flaccumfaciens]|uniref:NUDIX domain-containing protein n=1 Tax=Curtobacterium flaccumfaciens TaxID=2035 RepID=UPI002659A15C|nr:NUDIX domain-containing protein [Curtobacterium flaccumfaciens]MCS5510887.1 NUDIX domain-containing protein [Curtobacterium flaccumfaciens pv. flaccumfaciens]MCX2787030.1 NUDIX domain-containing protein [Curtobacterium flaccumfaciens pv. flaccumfaciens]
MVVSAGLLLHRTGPSGPEVFLAHMGGPFWRNRPRGWSIPKGLVEAGEEPLGTALREFAEEIGVPAPVSAADLTDLGEFRQASGKRVRVFAARASGFSVDTVRSNTVRLELPRGSGRFVEVPEVDDARWVGLDEARELVVAGQVAALDALVALGRAAGGS